MKYIVATAASNRYILDENQRLIGMIDPGDIKDENSFPPGEYDASVLNHLINDDISVYRNFVDKGSSDTTFDFCLHHVQWHDELNVIGSDDKVKINRKMAYMSEKPSVYRYANFYFDGMLLMGHVNEIRCMLESHLHKPFNSVLLNYYKDGKDEIKWHSDKEESLGDHPVIACVNLGATRKFWFRSKEKGSDKFYKLVRHGDLLVMGQNCQKNYLHAILPEKEVTEPRISLTYRYNFTENNNDSNRQHKEEGTV